MRHLIIELVMGAFLLTSIPALAIEPIPKETGFSGFLNIGLAHLNVENNTLAGNKWINVAEKTVDSIFASPDSESSISPILNGESRSMARNRKMTFMVWHSQAFGNDPLACPRGLVWWAILATLKATPISISMTRR
jgi:hypothetical protein